MKSAWLAAAFLFLAVEAGACERARPIALSFHPSESDASLRFEGYQDAVARAAPGYVRVIVCQPASAPGRESGEMASGIINGASGVVVDASGLVVTAAHIALDVKNDAFIITMDGRGLKARILRVDPARELALLQVAPFPGMKVAEFADSDTLKGAEPVFAVGTPDNRGGVVSLGRVLVPKLEGRLEYNGFGFADAIKMRIDVVPGNSGGPVFDRAGKLIGIIGAFGLPDPGEKASRLGYAVPSNAIRAYLARR